MSKRIALPAAIKAIRAAKAAQDPNYRVSRFAIRCGMSTGHLCNIESGERRATEEAIFRIAEALDVPVDAISYELATEAAA